MSPTFKKHNKMKKPMARKHAVSGMTNNTAPENTKDCIITKAIAPGALLTPMVAEALADAEPAEGSSPVCYANSPGLREGFGEGQ